jgi:hypothetical protein
MQTSSIIQIFHWIDRNFRVVILGGQLLIPLTILILGGPKYWGNLFHGATPMTIQEITTVADLESFDRTYVTTRIKTVINTGASITWTKQRKGAVVSRETSQFVLAPMGEKMLIVQTWSSLPSEGDSREITGELKAIPEDLQASLAVPIKAQMGTTVLPFMLVEENNGSYVLIGYFGLTIATIFTLLALRTTSNIRKFGRGLNAE